MKGEQEVAKKMKKKKPLKLHWLCCMYVINIYTLVRSVAILVNKKKILRFKYVRIGVLVHMFAWFPIYSPNIQEMVKRKCLRNNARWSSLYLL